MYHMYTFIIFIYLMYIKYECIYNDHIRNILRIQLHLIYFIYLS